ncbi:MAG: phenylalanine--tRNA ligase beta subunit-related protein [Candidatus Nezhaarchaeales archaeon]
MIKVEECIASLGVFLKWCILQGVKVYDSSSREFVVNVVKRTLEEVRCALTFENLKDHPIIRAFRDFYWRLGIDPTKVRPSAEALIRRALRYGSIPLINNIVDLGNVASMKTMIPIGIYDLDKVSLPLTLRRACEGEIFYPIGGKPVSLSRKEIVLVDSNNVVIHVFPHRDSAHTMVREDTKNILILACGVNGVEERKVQEAVEMASKLILWLCSMQTPSNTSER